MPSRAAPFTPAARADRLTSIEQRAAVDGPQATPELASLGGVTQLTTSHNTSCALLTDGGVACGQTTTGATAAFHPVLGTAP